MSSFKLLRPSRPLWNQVWGMLANKYGDTACKDASTGEVWQYMGSVLKGTTIEHQFRHRNLKGKRVGYGVTSTYDPDDYS